MVDILGPLCRIRQSSTRNHEIKKTSWIARGWIPIYIVAQGLTGTKNLRGMRETGFMAKGLTQVSWQMPQHWRKPLAVLAAEAGAPKQCVLIAAIACLYRLPDRERLALIQGVNGALQAQTIGSLPVEQAAARILAGS